MRLKKWFNKLWWVSLIWGLPLAFFDTTIYAVRRWWGKYEPLQGTPRVTIQRVMRGFIMLFVFICIAYMHGSDARNAQQFIFSLYIMVLFGLLLDNWWLTAFLWWTIALFAYHNDPTGTLYVSNVFFGLVLYYIVKKAFTKDRIYLFFNAILWLCIANLTLMLLQLHGHDPIHMMKIHSLNKYVEVHRDPAGFMGYKAAMGMLMAMSMPILFSRANLASKIGAFAMFIPLYISRASSCMVAGIAGLLFVVFYQYRKFFWYLLVALLILCSLYIKYVDMPMGTMHERVGQWKTVIRDYTGYPIVGWGLDSFRNITKKKKQRYCLAPVNDKGNIHIPIWDNPHNLVVSLLFEWGLVGLIIAVGYVRSCIMRFGRSVKTRNLLALSGFIVVTCVVSVGHFPMFLAEFVVIIIPMVALFEIETEGVRDERVFAEQYY